MTATKPKINHNTDSELPLFFKKPIMLDAQRHANAGIKAKATYKFAQHTNAVPISAAELHLAAKHYPIVFSLGEEPTLLAVLGLEKDNDYVNAKGEWKAGVYIPAYMRKYPFVLLDLPEENKLVLCVDEESEHYTETRCKDVTKFYEEGKPSGMSLEVLDFCTAFQGQFNATKEFCKALKAEGLLLESQSDVQINDGRKIQLKGFQMIEPEKVQALSDSKVLEFHKKGWLPLLYFIFLSKSNWGALVDFAAERKGTVATH